MNAKFNDWINTNSELIAKIVGRNIFLNENIYPTDLEENSLIDFAKKIFSLPDFYAHYGGAGDALLLMAAFYDKNPRATILSLANSANAISAFFDAFPLLENIILCPPPKEIIHSAVLRQITGNAKNCLGMGTTPAGNYADEWNEHLDIFSQYGVVKNPLWVGNFRIEKFFSQQIVLAPKGSGMALLRNIIPPDDWRKILSFLQEKNISPVIIGTPDEAADYPAEGNCLDKRSWSFAEQMGIVASADLLIAADSWHKTFAGLADVPALVYEPELDPSVHGTEIISDHVFYRSWNKIFRVKNFSELEKKFSELIPENVWEHLFM